jgi:CBS domain-containing protein
MQAKEVRQVMKSPVATVQEDTAVAGVVNLMLRKGINRLPVMRGADIVGIITRHDLLKLMASSQSVGSRT